MGIAVECEKCGKKYRVADERSGDRVRCKICGHAINVPAVLRHERTKDFELAIGNNETIDRVTEHVAKHVGEPAGVYHELVSDLVHIDVHHVPPTSDFAMHTLVTSGMSDRPMTVPEGAEAYRFAELLVCLPASWAISQDAFKEDRYFWPVRWLKILARLPHEYDTQLWSLDTVPNGDPPEPFADTTRFCGWIVIPPFWFPEEFFELEVGGEKTIRFFGIIPLYREEMNLKLKRGADELFNRLGQFDVLELMDSNRPSVCRREFASPTRPAPNRLRNRPKPVPIVAHDFSTPEGAILCLEDAYRSKDIDAVVACKDFGSEARLLLEKLPALSPQDIDEGLIRKTAEVLELAYRDEIERKGFPDMTGVAVSFGGTQPFGKDIVIVTEIQRFDDGRVAEQKILVVRRSDGWRVLVPLDALGAGHSEHAPKQNGPSPSREDSGLGELRRVFRPSRANLVVDLALGLLLIAGGLAIWGLVGVGIHDRGGRLSGRDWENLDWWTASLGLVFGLALAGGGALVLRQVWGLFSHRIEVFVGGLRYFRRGDCEVIPWDWIDCIRQIVHWQRLGPLARSEYCVTTKNTTKYGFDGQSIKDHEQLAEMLREAAASHDIDWHSEARVWPQLARIGGIVLSACVLASSVGVSAEIWLRTTGRLRRPAVKAMSREQIAEMLERIKTPAARVAGSEVISKDWLCKLSIPTGWTLRASLNPEATIELAHMTLEARFMVISDSKESLRGTALAGAGLEHVSLMLTTAMRERLQAPPDFHSVELEIAGLRGWRHVFRSSVGGIQMVHVHNTLEGSSHFHQVIAWCPEERYELVRHMFDSILASFREIDRAGGLEQ